MIAFTDDMRYANGWTGRVLIPHRRLPRDPCGYWLPALVLCEAVVVRNTGTNGIPSPPPLRRTPIRGASDATSQPPPSLTTRKVAAWLRKR